MKRLLAPLFTGALLASGSASAQETVDIGVIRESDISVVQKLLYPKTDRTELGVHLGWMPFDALLTTPNLQASFNLHMNETLSISAMLGGGYGLKNGTYRELESDKYGIAPDAYRYLGSALVGVELAPIYAKMNLGAARIIHYDVYGSARAGATFESSVIPTGGFAVAPTLSLGAGARFFVSPRSAIRLELRDDLLIERRKLTQTTHFKQNANITIGFTMLSAVKEKRR